MSINEDGEGFNQVLAAQDRFSLRAFGTCGRFDEHTASQLIRFCVEYLRPRGHVQRYVLDKDSSMRSDAFTAYAAANTAVVHYVSTGKHAGNDRIEVSLRILKTWFKRSLSVGLHHTWRSQVPIFFANYNATWSSVIDTAPYTLVTGRIYPRPSDPVITALLDADATASSFEAKVEEPPLDRGLLALRAKGHGGPPDLILAHGGPTAQIGEGLAGPGDCNDPCPSGDALYQGHDPQ
ncbi:hypothetical protein SARC_02110 [Sphaeroforma arctica JP610]|uniref:Integrase catalytic domain-containing protein n=1 Tax=Sphaeroforma arctica JP610 TaxID=667725 RepID=A0A0L0G9X1_9EUKA|nr:hypothetical protein SARC_02110 [Sphaeroforma arctica JP610]KNC85699.1 hypothetical protein SARC_02110 [Sphaeroforma arctica JP610]|eukprot:XP_014159601.1 hypothetical protein SARC_02110 [Sphaeroforma arctica JP610]